MVTFGILPNCRHCYCLDCIMNWRKTLTFNKEARLGCPVCRVESPFVLASAEWLEEGSEAKKWLIDKKKSIMAKQGCWYNSKGTCPYSSCLYSHKVLRSPRKHGNSVQDTSFSQWYNSFMPQQYMPPHWMYLD